MHVHVATVWSIKHEHQHFFTHSHSELCLNLLNGSMADKKLLRSITEEVQNQKRSGRQGGTRWRESAVLNLVLYSKTLNLKWTTILWSKCWLFSFIILSLNTKCVETVVLFYSLLKPAKNDFVGYIVCRLNEHWYHTTAHTRNLNVLLHWTAASVVQFWMRPVRTSGWYFENEHSRRTAREFSLTCCWQRLTTCFAFSCGRRYFLKQCLWGSNVFKKTKAEKLCFKKYQCTCEQGLSSRTGEI